jgi:hypothetical protein
MCKEMQELDRKDCSLDEMLSHVANCHECRQSLKSQASKVRLIEIRPEIMEVAEEAEKMMRKHDGQKGDSWKQCRIGFLRDKLDEEHQEFCEAYEQAFQPYLSNTTKFRAQLESIDEILVLIMLYHRLKEGN